MMKLYGNPMNIIILDACRNNPYTRSFRSLDRGLAQPETAPTGSIIAFATGRVFKVNLRPAKKKR